MANLCKSFILHVQRQFRSFFDVELLVFCEVCVMTEMLLLRISFDTEQVCPLQEVTRHAPYTSTLSSTSSSRPHPTINVELHEYTSVETIIYYVNLILPFAERLLIAECKDNAYLYIEETPINKRLKFRVCCSADSHFNDLQKTVDRTRLV